ncbi:hypothetical protein KBA27_06390 [bacterium]|nr:hypothetical protein [bacterium]
MDEKFMNTDELMVDFAEMTSYNFGNRPYLNADMSVEEMEVLPQTTKVFNFGDMLHNMVSKFGFRKVGA